MKKFFTTIFTLIIVCAIILGTIYAIDLNRMQNGKEVLFSTWGKDYTAKNISEVMSDSASVISPQIEKERECTLYFADANVMHLIAENRVLNIEDGVELSVAKALIQGPKDTEKYCPLISADTEINSVTRQGSLCIIDLNEEFSNFTLGSSMENMTLYSLVNSLCAIDGIDSVKININGNKSAMFGSHYSLEDAFKADMTLVN